LENNDVLYEKLPADISQRHVLLMDPILSTGHTTVKVIEVRGGGGRPLKGRESIGTCADAA
jgi:uridine kinase